MNTIWNMKRNRIQFGHCMKKVFSDTTEGMVMGKRQILIMDYIQVNGSCADMKRLVKDRIMWIAAMRRPAQRQNTDN